MTLFSLFICCLAASAALIPAVHAAFDPRSSNNVAIYWGQNSFHEAAGPWAQQRLNHYCKNEKLDIIPLAFLTNMGNPISLNFANSAPSELENDIEECQEVYNKTVVLSLGGEFTQGSGFTSTKEAVRGARQVWEAYGPPSPSSYNRKFGKAVVDGFDFDYEKPLSNVVPFAQELRRLMTEASEKGGKKYILTAAPQCIFPDANVGPLLEAVSFDAVFVQFYNNPSCSVKAFIPGAKEQPGFNFDTWQNWAQESKNPDVKVILGVPSTQTASTTGFVAGGRLIEVIAYCKNFGNFGGVMFWDMSQTWSAPEILNKAKEALGGSNRAEETLNPSALASSTSKSASVSSMKPSWKVSAALPSAPTTMIPSYLVHSQVLPPAP